MQTPIVPFSRRFEPKPAVENQFPETARVGLLHLLTDFVSADYVAGWPAVAQELRRIDRRNPEDYDPHATADVRAARDDARMVLNELPWQNAFDFCERLYTKLAIETRRWVEGEDGGTTDKTIDVVRSEIAIGIQQLFFEENFAYAFVDGQVVRSGNAHTMSRIDAANIALRDRRLDDARVHFRKALKFFRTRVAPDFENAVKEAVCAVEAAAKKLFSAASGDTLSDVMKRLSKQDEKRIPPALAKTFDGLYGFRGSANGVSHGAGGGGTVTAHIADYSIAVAASQIIYLVALEQSEDTATPF